MTASELYDDNLGQSAKRLVSSRREPYQRCMEAYICEMAITCHEI